MKVKTLFGVLILVSICSSAFAGVTAAKRPASTDPAQRTGDIRHTSAAQDLSLSNGIAARRAEIWKKLRGIHTSEDAQPMGCNFQCTNACSSAWTDCLQSHTNDYCEPLYWICMCENACCSGGCP